jgi:UDP-N-acetylglucosamine--N-acetylmuramyl-(pentapeptide) pyrophosphoryl-undecaprenol N-acetylglucosamine transferase
VTERRFALVTGGGTGGHTVPALAVARALLVDRPPGSVELIGSKRGLDSRLLDGVEVPVTLLGGRGFVRRASRSAVVSNLAAISGLMSAFAVSVVLVLRRRPKVVVAVGGYACIAPSIAAWIFGVPVIVLNVDAVPGAANRLLAKIARAAAVAYPGTDLPRAVVTGVPVRPEVAAVRDQPGVRSRARLQLGLPQSGRVVGVFGGSLGAKHLNEAVLGLVQRWSNRGDIAVYHVVGGRNAESAAAAAAAAGHPPGSRSRGSDSTDPRPGRALDPERASQGLVYEQVAYEDHMEFFYAASDVVVCRAGANTVAELTATGTPSVLVPLPGAPGDHQNANAAVLKRVGAAVVVSDDALDEDRLATELDAILGDPDRLKTMASAASGLGRPDAAEAVAALAASYARTGRRAA